MDAFLQFLERFEMIEARLTALEPIKEIGPNSPNEEAQVANRKGNSLIAIAEKPTLDQCAELSKLVGEEIPFEAFIAYTQYHKRGNKRFLTHYTKRIQDLITAYKENRLEDYLSEQVPDEDKEAG